MKSDEKKEEEEKEVKFKKAMTLEEMKQWNKDNPVEISRPTVEDYCNV